MVNYWCITFNNNLTVCWLHIAGSGTVSKSSDKTWSFPWPISYTTFVSTGRSLVLGGSGWGNVDRHFTVATLTNVTLEVSTGTGGSYTASGCNGTVIGIGI